MEAPGNGLQVLIKIVRVLCSLCSHRSAHDTDLQVASFFIAATRQRAFLYAISAAVIYHELTVQSRERKRRSYSIQPA